MALRVKSIDELTTELADAYDELIAPKKIWRNHNNKLYLMLRAYAAGNIGITDAALSLHNRFDPLRCEDFDLYNIAKIVGTEFKQGAGSMLRITAVNKSSMPKKLAEGVYNYQSASGMVFYFQIPEPGYEFSPEESRLITAVSREKGRYGVSDNANISLFRSDGGTIDSMLAFSCEDNAGLLGYDDETPLDFRTRILSDGDRQDVLKELELRIRNLPSILECSLIFNEETTAQLYDGITLAPKELLITLTGAPTDEIAKMVCESVIYDTHKISDDQVLWYYNDLYINGCRPVYYRTHSYTDFSLVVNYQYKPMQLKPSQIEEAINAIYAPYRQMAVHQSMFREQDAYEAIAGLSMPSLSILNIDIKNSNGVTVPYIQIPKTRLLRLTGISYIPAEIGGVV